MDNSVKVLKAAKVGAVLNVTRAGRASAVYSVTDRYSKRGRGGYTRLTLTPFPNTVIAGSAVGDTLTFRLRRMLPLDIVNVQKVYKRVPRARKAGTPFARAGSEAAMGGFGKVSGEDPELKRLRDENSRLRTEAFDLNVAARNARQNASMWERLYQMNKGTNHGGGVRVSVDAMQFLRFSGISQFPCNAEELKKGRGAMISKLHPDHTQKDSNAQFVSAMRGYDELSRLVK